MFVSMKKDQEVNHSTTVEEHLDKLLHGKSTFKKATTVATSLVPLEY